jgi:hypothetical protein
MPATVLTAPLRLACVFSDGSARTWTVEVEQAPDALVTADLITGLAGLIHPHGTMDKVSTIAAGTSKRRRPWCAGWPNAVSSAGRRS